jgi:hypothetical protein
MVHQTRPDADSTPGPAHSRRTATLPIVGGRRHVEPFDDIDRFAPLVELLPKRRQLAVAVAGLDTRYRHIFSCYFVIAPLSGRVSLHAAPQIV